MSTSTALVGKLYALVVLRLFTTLLVLGYYLAFKRKSYVVGARCLESPATDMFLPSDQIQYNYNSNATLPFHLFASTLAQNNQLTNSAAITILWLFLCFVLALSVHAGFVCLEVGSIHLRSSQHVLTKNLGEICISALLFYTIGFTFSFVEGDSIYGYSEKGHGHLLQGNFNANHWKSERVPGYNEAFWLFQWARSTIGLGVVSTSIADRLQNFASYYYTIAYMLTIYPAIAHWAWSATGWASAFNPIQSDLLFGVGVIDFGGSGVIHCTGGMAALMGLVFIGPRLGRYDSEGEPYEDSGFTQLRQRSAAMHSLGTIIIWIGWYGMTCGSSLRFAGTSVDAAARIAMTTTISAGSSGLCTFVWAVLWSSFVQVDSDAHAGIMENPSNFIAANNGIIGGLVAISAGCATVDAAGALLIGVFASVVYFVTSKNLTKWQIDDVADGVPIHLACGIWGMIAAAIFSTKANYELAYGNLNRGASCGVFYSCEGKGWNQLGANLVFLLAALAWSALLSASTFAVCQVFGLLRIPKHEELGSLVGGEALATNKSPPAILALGYQYRAKTKALLAYNTQVAINELSPLPGTPGITL